MSQEELDARAAHLKGQIVASGSAVLDVICMDLVRYLEREARRRFVQHVAFASTMDEQRLVALKQALKGLDQELQGGLKAQLEGSDAWVTAAAPEDRKSLRGNREVWAAIQAVACKLSGLLAEYGFPPDTDGGEPAYELAYDTPRYFIGRAYCPGLIEAYWKQVEELGAVRETLAERSRNASQEALGARWDAIG